ERSLLHSTFSTLELAKLDLQPLWKPFKVKKSILSVSIRSTLNHLMCMSYTDVDQVANAARNYEILHERDDEDTERPDKRQRSGDRHQPTSQQSSHKSHGHHNDRNGSDRQGGSDNHRSSNHNYSGSNNRNSGYGRDQRNRGQQSNRSANSGSQQSRGPSEGYSYPVCTTCGRRHPGECRRAAGRLVGIGISRPLSRVVTGATVKITTVRDLTGVVATTTTAATTTTITTLAVTTVPLAKGWDVL
nr:zinc finger, CCHC-type, retrotransposon Gag domain protein [Tanacetum cinerariifolium]